MNTASALNFTSPYFRFTGDIVGGDESTYTFATSSNDSASVNIPSSYFTTPKNIRVGVAEGNQTEVTYDTITIAAVKAGSSGASSQFYYIKPLKLIRKVLRKNTLSH